MKYFRLKSLINQAGFTQWVILIVLMFGIGVGVWVAQIRTNLVPQAKVAPSAVAITELSLNLNEAVILNKPFDLQVLVRSDLDPVRLVTAHIKYDPSVLEISKINTPSSTQSAVVYATASATPAQNQAAVSQWLENLFDNKTGTAAITGLYANGDLKTEPNKAAEVFVTITMKAKKLTPTEISLEESSQVLRSADSANILTTRKQLRIEPQSTESREQN